MVHESVSRHTIGIGTMIDLSHVSEKAFQSMLVKTAKELGYTQFHVFDARRSNPGFPDLVLIKPPRIIFAELKREGGHPTPAQRDWLEMLKACPGVETFLWYPSDWDDIVKILLGVST